MDIYRLVCGVLQSVCRRWKCGTLLYFSFTTGYLYVSVKKTIIIVKKTYKEEKEKYTFMMHSTIEQNKMIKLVGSNEEHVNKALAILNGQNCEKGLNFFSQNEIDSIINSEL